MTDRLLSVTEAAELLGRTQLAIYRLVARRKIPFRKSGKRVVFIERELREYVDALPGVTLDELRERERAGV